MSVENPAHERETLIHNLSLQYQKINQDVRRELVAFDGFIQTAIDTLDPPNNVGEHFSPEEIDTRVTDLNAHFSRMKECLFGALTTLKQTEQNRESLILLAEKTLPESIQTPLRELKRFLELHNLVNLLSLIKYNALLAPVADEGERLGLAHEALLETLQQIIEKDSIL